MKNGINEGINEKAQESIGLENENEMKTNFRSKAEQSVYPEK